jgi:hypothetical protein
LSQDVERALPGAYDRRIERDFLTDLSGGDQSVAYRGDLARRVDKIVDLHRLHLGPGRPRGGRQLEIRRFQASMRC